MQQFKIKDGWFKELRWKIIFRAGSILLILLAWVIYMSMNDPNNGHDVNILPIIIPIVLIAICVGLFIGIRRQKAIFNSYVLSITDNMITREQQHTQTISLYLNEIVEIVKQVDGSFTVKGKDPEDLIGIPAQIENYLQLEAVLQNIQPIASPKKLPIWQRYPSLVGLLVVVLMAGVFTSNNKIIVLLTGTPLVALLVWSYKAIQSSKNVDDRTKKSSRWVLLVLASIICGMIFKLTGWEH